MQPIIYILVGLAAGFLSGLFGIGGGSILIPAFVLLFGLSQHSAQGTTLATMLPPVFILAVWKYYQQGNVNISIAMFTAIGLTVGGLLGAQVVPMIPDDTLKRAFGVFLVLVGLRMALIK